MDSSPISSYQGIKTHQSPTPQKLLMSRQTPLENSRSQNMSHASQNRRDHENNLITPLKQKRDRDIKSVITASA